MAESTPEVPVATPAPEPAKKAPRKRAAKKAAASSSVVVFMGDNLRGFDPQQKVHVDQETADFLVEHGHASLPKSKQ